jgi:phosphatidylethanolamine-binding protein
MKSVNALALLLLACISAAQTPAGFTPEVTAHLEVIFGTKVVDPPGTALTKSGKDITRLSHQVTSRL